MRHINRVTIIGEVKGEVKPSEKFTNFKVLTRRENKGQTFETTLSVSAWGEGASVASGLSEGQLVYLEGEVKNRSYDKNGQTVWVTEISAGTVAPITAAEGGSYAEPGMPF